MQIKEVTRTDFDEWLQLALELWPDSESQEMQSILTDIEQSPKQAGFLVRDDAGTAVGFMNLSLRTDYVPGATQLPVAYVEGIYVQEAHQQRGVGSQLIQQAEQWAREQGCGQLASDVLLDNPMSAAFHEKVGFEEVERTIFFIKPVE